MKRICIYVIYDFENIIDDYIGYMLQEIRKVIDCLIVVCNCEYIDKGIENIYSYADKIYYRSNRGFDAGAYKDALCEYIGWDEVCMYDELLLINDSFYGPLYPIEDLFNAMENVDADYWGITRSPGGVFGNGKQYDSHIQSYFMAFKNQIVQNGKFQDFWNNMNYSSTLDQTISLFEIGCNKLLAENGFKGSSLMDVRPLKIEFAENDNPYIRYPLDLVRDIRVPVFKRKSLVLYNKGFENALKALEYIDINTDYKIELIWNHLRRTSRRVNSHEIINYIKLERFYSSHPRVYIYGAGLYGRNMSKYFAYRGWSLGGLLVTHADSWATDCTPIDSADIAENDGIIIAVGNKDVYEEILDILVGHCGREQIYNTECDWE